MQGMDQNIKKSSILDINQDHVTFTGERIVINQQVKENARTNNILKEHMVRYELASSFVKEKKVLDAACGTGYGTKMLKCAGAEHVTGIDISQESIDNALLTYQEDHIEFIQGDVYHLPFSGEVFDVIVSFETIEHIASGEALLKEAARILKIGGTLIISTPNRSISNPGLYMEERPINNYHPYEYKTIEFIGELLKYFDILELYGQGFIEDCDTFATKVMRQARNLNVDYKPRPNQKVPSHYVIPLGEMKNADPTYIVAVCTKKNNSCLISL
ncbi:MAG: hypothetical protein K0R69_1015 [Clostridia bacterium]|jgi:2-polyprenyl-3-methyl-5-hydroxy-6-metoxy-1,4-benzoquinol methylase|nr:hypothetical protein [Clostridia bacterium]